MKSNDFTLIKTEYKDATIGIYKNKKQPDTKNVASVLHTHEYYELHFMLDGSFEYWIDNKNVVLNKGEFMIITPGTLHYSFYNAKGCNIICLELLVEKIRNDNYKCVFYDYFKNSLDINSSKPISCSRELMKNITYFYDNSTDFTIETYCYFKACIAEIVYNLFNDINGFGKDNPQIESIEVSGDILYMIDNMINGNFSLEEISQKINYSTRHTARLIKLQYNMSLSDIRNKRRIEMAKKLLDTTDMTLEEIVTKVGFVSAVHMRKTFMKYENISPVEYRKQKR